METDREPEEIEFNKEIQAEKSEDTTKNFEKVKRIKEEEYKKSAIMNYWLGKIGDRIETNQIH